MPTTKLCLLAFSPAKLIAPTQLLTARPPLGHRHPSPLGDTTARAVVISAVLTTILAQRGFAHGGIND
jgi:hypothetical protein